MQFLKFVQSVFATALFVAVLVSPAAAKNDHWKDKPWKEKGSVPAPAPIAGAGLIAIGAAGVAMYAAIRRKGKSGRD
jgi:hypothetical protein